MNLENEKDVEIVAEKVLAKIRDKIKDQIADEFYAEYRVCLEEHYTNHKDKIDERLITEISNQFAKDPKSYKYLEIRKRLYAENKTEIDKLITEDVIKEGMQDALGIYTCGAFHMDWRWKDGIVGLILRNWDNFEDDERIKAAFGNHLEQKQSRIDELENRILEIASALDRKGE